MRGDNRVTGGQVDTCEVVAKALEVYEYGRQLGDRWADDVEGASHDLAVYARKLLQNAGYDRQKAKPLLDTLFNGITWVDGRAFFRNVDNQ
jgi:hypothetical protein